MLEARLFLAAMCAAAHTQIGDEVVERLSWCRRQQEDESPCSGQMMIESHIFNLVLKDTSISTCYQWAHSAL